MRQIFLLLVLAAISGFQTGHAAVHPPADNRLTQADFEIVLSVATFLRKCRGMEAITDERLGRLIKLGVAGEMKIRFLENLTPWSSDRAKLEGLDPTKADDVRSMFGLLSDDSSRPGTTLDTRVWATQVSLIAYYLALAADCETPLGFQALLPRLSADAWSPLRVGDNDLAAIGKDIDRVWDCFWKHIPPANASSGDAIRAYVGTNGDIKELRRDAYDFAVNLEAAKDRNSAGIYMSAVPTRGEPAEDAQFLMGIFLGSPTQWSLLPDRVRAIALGTYHAGQATPSCRLASQTLALIGKRHGTDLPHSPIPTTDKDPR